MAQGRAVRHLSARCAAGCVVRTVPGGGGDDGPAAESEADRQPRQQGLLRQGDRGDNALPCMHGVFAGKIVTATAFIGICNRTRRHSVHACNLASCFAFRLCRPRCRCALCTYRSSYYSLRNLRGTADYSGSDYRLRPIVTLDAERVTSDRSANPRAGGQDGKQVRKQCNYGRGGVLPAFVCSPLPARPATVDCITSPTTVPFVPVSFDSATTTRCDHRHPLGACCRRLVARRTIGSPHPRPQPRRQQGDERDRLRIALSSHIV